MQVDSNALNDHRFRQHYMKTQVSNRQLAERKVEKKKLLAKHAEEIKTDTKKNLVFKFVKQAYVS